GGRLVFQNPIDLTPQFADPFTFLEMAIKFLPGQIRTGPNGTTGGSDYSGPRGYGGPGGPGGPGGSGLFPGAPGVPGGVGDASDPAAALLITPDTQRLRVLMQFEGGTAVAEDHPLIRFPTSEPGWVRVAIPFTQ